MKGRKVPVDLTQKKMIYVGDFPIKSGFGVVSKNLLARFPYDKYIMGVNYWGDWTEEVGKYKIWPANNGPDDIYGYGKIYNFLIAVKPSVLFLLNDPWCITPYKKAILKYKEEYPLRVVIYTPVDTDYMPEEYVEPLNEFVDHVVTYTQFGVNVLKQAGLTIPVSWITHGVDTNIFKPENKVLTLNKLGIPQDSYVVLTVSANNPRKRLDMTVQTFAEWVRRYDLPKNVRWYFHGPLTGYGQNVLRLTEQYGVKDRLILSDPNMTTQNSITDDQMRMVYNSADLYYSTTASEGGI